MDTGALLSIITAKNVRMLHDSSREVSGRGCSVAVANPF